MTAIDLIRTLYVVKEWKCALICSGDGLIYEVFNGLLRRPDWRRAIQFPVGVIPCGTGNALAASILWRSGESLKSAALIPSAAFIGETTTTTTMIDLKASKKSLITDRVDI